mgnify:CR=1 FL=1
MILVTLGTQDKSFKRLLDKIEKEINEGKIKEKIIVQAGYTDFNSNNMIIKKLIPMDEFDELIEKCDILITHGGVGSIITGLRKNKKVIAVARLKKYKEHTNDHQLQIIDNFTKAGYILNLDDFDSISDAINEAKKFIPNKYVSNKDNFVKTVEGIIDDYLKLP